MSSFYKQFIEKGISSIFYRLVVPKGNADGKPNVIPNLVLDDLKSIYVPTTGKAAATFGTWTFNVTEVALNDREKLPILKDQIKEGLNTVLYIHGFFESTNAISVRTVMNGYLERGDHNILLLDWSVLGHKSYLLSFAVVETIGRYVNENLRYLESCGIIKTNEIHFVGYSVGAHIAGCICKKLTNIKRLTGLDPAGPLFKWYKKEESMISKGDAEFVDIIHTDGTRFGMETPLGDVDFYPNGGKMLQPGCKFCNEFRIMTPKRLCSHWRSWRFFAESLVREEAFLAGAADSWEEFKEGKISNVIPMGIQTPMGSSGRYYLQTSRQPPFGKGKDGLKYVDEESKESD